MTIEEIKELMQEFDASGIAELELEISDGRLTLKKHPAQVQTNMAPGPAVFQTGMAPGFAAGTAVPQAAEMQNQPAQTPSEQSAAAASAAEAAPSGSAQTTVSAALTDVTAPLAGIFYCASSPEAEPFVSEGTRVEKGETIGLIEAMKIISEIPAPCSGIVRNIAAKNADFTAFGALLMQIEEG